MTIWRRDGGVGGVVVVTHHSFRVVSLCRCCRSETIQLGSYTSSVHSSSERRTIPIILSKKNERPTQVRPPPHSLLWRCIVAPAALLWMTVCELHQSEDAEEDNYIKLYYYLVYEVETGFVAKRTNPRHISSCSTLGLLFHHWLY